jgi:hypothetical protein
MVGWDHASQYRWRKANLAVAPAVLPVIAGYRPVAARPAPGRLRIDMVGPTWVEAWISECGVGCEADGPSLPIGTVTVVADGYQIVLFKADRGMSVGPVRIRPASLDELARLPLGPDYGSD